MNETSYFLLGSGISILLPPLLPYFILKSGRHAMKGDYGAVPFLFFGTVALGALTLYILDTWCNCFIFSFDC